MKKILAIALAVVMVLSIGAVASAFNWAGSSSTSTDFGYQIDVIKFTTQTQAFGSASFQEDNAATAVNGAPVYFAIRLTVPDLAADNDIRLSAKAKVEFTAISGVSGTGSDGISIANLDKGTYYYYDKTNSFQKIDFFRANVLEMNVISETPIYAMTCLDTDTAKVYAEVTSNRPLTSIFNVGKYDVVKRSLGGAAAVGPNVTIVDGNVAAPTITAGTDRAAATRLAFTLPEISNPDATTLQITFGDKVVKVDVPANSNPGGAWIATQVANALGTANSTIVSIAGVPFQFAVANDVITFTEQQTAVGADFSTKFSANSVPYTVEALGGTAAVAASKVVEFRKAGTPVGSGDIIAILPLDANSKAITIISSADEAGRYDGANGPIAAAYSAGNGAYTTQWANDSAALTDLLAWLDDGNSKSFKDAVAAGEVYMTDANMRKAFGFANKVSDEITWQANSTPIILDPTISIPKTGDNASVIGFAMIMVAVVAAAVAVKKVKA